MICTLQDLLKAGVNGFAVRLLAKDFEKMKVEAALGEPIHVPVSIAEGKTIWVTFSDVAPAEAPPPAPAT